MTKRVLEATGEYPFTFFIEKAVPLDGDDGMLLVEGVASTLNVDHDNERMGESALRSMATIINEKSVPLRLEHNREDSAIVGSVYKAWIDERNQLWVRAAIDPQHPAGPMLHESLKQGSKFGLSVGGRVKNAVRELVESTGKMVKTFYDVVLDEVSVTRRPANYDAWLFAKHYKEEGEDATPFYKSSLYREFLFENRQLDYLYQFAKSVPDSEWKINNLNDKTMKEEDKKDKVEEKSEESKEDSKEKSSADSMDHEEEKEKSYVTKGEFSKFAGSVLKAIQGIAKALESNPKDTNNPDKDKEETIGDGKDAKKSEGKDEEEKEKSDESAHDQDNPTKDKEENPGDGKDAVKSEEKEGEEKEKAESKDDEGEEKEKGEKDKEDEDDADKSIDSAIKSIESIGKRMSGEKVTKSEKVEKSSKLSSIDRFAATMVLAMEAMEDRVEKSGNRIPGFRQAFVEAIRSDKELQSEIFGMMKEAGFKKSVAMGIPYMVTKDGKRFALSATPVESSKEEVKKSREGKSFKDVYKTDFSAFRPEGE